MKVFIGSSKEAVDSGAVDKLCLWVEDCGHQPIRWDGAGAFAPGSYSLQQLQRVASTVGAAIFVFSEDDKIWYRGESKVSPRDNVVLELGLFIGRLDQNRAIVCRTGKPKLPSDLDGVTYIDLQKEARAKMEVREWLSGVIKAASIPSSKLILCHTNKYSMNDSNGFWHHIRADAQSDLIIVGDTNKSWIGRDPIESEQFAQQIINFCLTSSRCALVSSDEAVKATKHFLSHQVLPLINRCEKRVRQRIRRALPNCFTYSVTDQITYKAVLSDDRLVILPNVVAKEFREESMVLEMTKSTHPVEFGYYAQDIRRLVEQSARPDILNDIVHAITA